MHKNVLIIINKFNINIKGAYYEEIPDIMTWKGDYRIVPHLTLNITDWFPIPPDGS